MTGQDLAEKSDGELIETAELVAVFAQRPPNKNLDLSVRSKPTATLSP